MVQRPDTTPYQVTAAPTYQEYGGYDPYVGTEYKGSKFTDGFQDSGYTSAADSAAYINSLYADLGMTAPQDIRGAQYQNLYSNLDNALNAVAGNSALRGGIQTGGQSRQVQSIFAPAAAGFEKDYRDALMLWDRNRADAALGYGRDSSNYALDAETTRSQQALDVWKEEERRLLDAWSKGEDIGLGVWEKMADQDLSAWEYGQNREFNVWDRTNTLGQAAHSAAMTADANIYGTDVNAETSRYATDVEKGSADTDLLLQLLSDRGGIEEMYATGEIDYDTYISLMNEFTDGGKGDVLEGLKSDLNYGAPTSNNTQRRFTVDRG